MSAGDLPIPVPPDRDPPELTAGPLALGVLLGVIFGASSIYLTLKVGLTVSASIPVAVLAITLLRAFSRAFAVRRANILENNMVQTTGSGGESIAFGVGVTMPALMILGYDMDVGRVMIVAVLGSVLGILLFSPMRRPMMADASLAFPEGTACAEVLKVGESGGSNAKVVFGGFFVGLLYKLLMAGVHLWREVPKLVFGKAFPGGSVGAEISPELLGVGFIVGLRVGGIMLGGGVLSYLVLIPMITFFGGAGGEVVFPGTKPIAEMGIDEIRNAYVLYIGAGAVAAGGIISMARSMPTIVASLAGGLKSMSKGKGAGATERTDRELSMKFVLGGALAVVAAITISPFFPVGILGAILMTLFAFLFVTVSGRLTGEIGSSSNPISGMTVATLLMTCLIFLAVGFVGPEHRLGALTIAGVVCVAASVGGATAQVLKTGKLVGATPRRQQIGMLLGSATSALVIGFTLLLLNGASTVYTQKDEAVGKKAPIERVSDVREPVRGPEALADSAEYRVLQLPKPEAGIPAGKYLVDDAGTIKYLVDPGINGRIKERDDGTPVVKYDAPKASLMALITDGILTQQLPWVLVILGVMIAVVLELASVSSLPFAVGVYLPISASAPIFLGGLIRYWADRRRTAARRRQGLDAESDLEAESSPGVLMSSGLIAGGAIAGIALALLALAPEIQAAMNLGEAGWELGDGLSLVPFGLLMVYLARVAVQRR
ncbi:MAG: oligopeptide transporter, OPT family [Nannocystaceae bacterium]